jgi:hypothetical protein
MYSIFGDFIPAVVLTVVLLLRDSLPSLFNFSPFSFVSPSLAAFLTQTVQLDDATVKFEIWYVFILRRSVFKVNKRRQLSLLI